MKTLHEQTPDLFQYAESSARRLKPAPAHPAARASDPETSAAAAIDAGRFASGNRLLALRLLRVGGPQTDFELAELSGLQQTSIGKRRGECFQAGLVEKHTIGGEVVKRPAPSGSASIVWAISAAGVAFLDARSPESCGKP